MFSQNQKFNQNKHKTKNENYNTMNQFIKLFIIALCALAVRADTTTGTNSLRGSEETEVRQLVDCFVGTGSEATEWCAAEEGRRCCQGTDACNFSGQKTICSGSCNGQAACFRFGGSSVAADSCNGLGACQEFAGTGVAQQSCNSQAACFRFNGNAVGKESCNNFQACHAADATGVPTLMGCNAFAECDDKVVGFLYGTAEEVTAACGDKCCQGVGACSWSGSKKIGIGSCMGTFACKDLTANAIGTNAC